MAVTRAILYRPRLRVELEDIQEDLPAVQFNSTFELNSIPSGSVTIALGNEFHSGRASPVHAISDALSQRRRRIKVYLTMDMGGVGAAAVEVRSLTLGIPAGEFLVFEGFTGLSTVSLAPGSARFTIQIVHWLDDLNFSSVFSKTSHPANLGDYTFGALSNGDAGATGGGPDAPTDRHWTGLTHAMTHFTNVTVETDLWLAAIRPWFEELCSQDWWEAAERPDIKGGGANDQALAALARMGGGDCYVPLAMDLTADEDTAEAIAHSASRMTENPEDMAHITIWDSLVAKFGAEYIFSVVPLVDRALVVPFIPGYRKAFRTITPDQEVQVEWTSFANRTLRGMGIMTTMEMITGAGLAPPNAEFNMGIGGFYSSDPTSPGQIQTRSGPDWLTRFSSTRFVDESVGVAGAAIPDGAVPWVAAPDRGAAAAGRAAAAKRFLDLYAQAIYALEIIRGRQCVGAGPVRFDIAPGSTVLVYPSGNPAIADDRLKAPFYATVMRVSTYLDAEGVQAGTGFHFAHCRGEAENASDRASVAKHPLYRNTFSGCGLL